MIAKTIKQISLSLFSLSLRLRHLYLHCSTVTIPQYLYDHCWLPNGCSTTRTTTYQNIFVVTIIIVVIIIINSSNSRIVAWLFHRIYSYQHLTSVVCHTISLASVSAPWAIRDNTSSFLPHLEADINRSARFKSAGEFKDIFLFHEIQWFRSKQ